MSRVNCRQHFFVVRAVKVWNNLPADVVCANSVSEFVRKLKSVDFSLFLIGNDCLSSVLYLICLRPRVSGSYPSSALAAETIITRLLWFLLTALLCFASIIK